MAVAAVPQAVVSSALAVPAVVGVPHEAEVLNVAAVAAKAADPSAQLCVRQEKYLGRWKLGTAKIQSDLISVSQARVLCTGDRSRYWANYR